MRTVSILVSQRVYANHGYRHQGYLCNEYDHDGGVEILLELAHLAGGVEAVQLDLGLLSRIHHYPVGPVGVREESADVSGDEGQ